MYQLRRVSEAIKRLDIHSFLELERIKRPSTVILSVTKCVCVFFEIFKESEQEQMDKVSELAVWKDL